VGGSHGKAEKPISFNVLESIVLGKVDILGFTTIAINSKVWKKILVFCKMSTTPTIVPNSNVSNKHFLESFIHVF
jgi:hypothetical protein